MVQAVLDHKARDIKRYPCKSNRASSLGYFVPVLGGCLRRGVYERVAWQEKELYTAQTQLVFDEGHYQEERILQDLAAAGVNIIEQQTMYEWPEYNITGHIDGKILTDGTAIPLEIKSMNPNIFARMHTFEDFDKKPWTRAYKAQGTVYMLMQNCDRMVFLLKDKSNGTMRQIEVPLDYELGEACIQTAQAINEHVEREELPERIDDREKCKSCPFRAVCLPDIDFGVPLRIVDDPQFEAKLDQAAELKDAADEYKRLWDKVRSEAKAQAGDSGELNMMVGKYTCTGKPDSRGAFRFSVEVV